MLLRTFLRGLARRVVQSMVRRTVTRALIRNRAGGSIRRMADSGDGVVDDLENMVDIFDLLELSAEIPQILDNARNAAAEAGNSVFESQMGQYNPGQKVLVEQYCIPYVEEYWQTTGSPDPESFLNGIFSQHEAIEQALSDSCAQSYDAGSEAGIASLYQDIAVYVATEVAARMTDVTGSPWSSKAMQDYGADVYTNRKMVEELVKAGKAPSYYKYRYDDGEFQYMKIHGSSSSGFARRELSEEQFMGVDVPYWHTEGRRLLMAKVSGQLSDEDYLYYRDRLWNSSYSNPWSTSAPAGYSAPSFNDVHGYGI